MKNPDPRSWMWSDAVDMLARAERLHRQTFRPSRGQASCARWEPPVDVLETEHELLVLAALPGVDPEHITVTINNGTLLIAGERVLPPELRFARIHRLELPQGRFERELVLPSGRFEVARPTMINGCLVIILRKLA
ncbi:MAG TPA: Hsp20/alpha crystallin family protein [Geminicoccus sp.]|jgi:HSP20 family molecular chaperone IbpA|uniref:Hsp20/alpha crystallin family protein n=1 Tax=Geminicoccus sp. TaxID=2024832 RepID=UPI002E356A96|nr:Hsp20/alpha crystallin family protein [Geminicoccus sp.]HEX2529465.1 Hsp20/alpha crystallin family protein [Geminicoccus sp.]